MPFSYRSRRSGDGVTVDHNGVHRNRMRVPGMFRRRHVGGGPHVSTGPTVGGGVHTRRPWGLRRGFGRRRGPAITV